jgi:hypothetical protein
MPETTNLFQDGVDRVREAYGSLGTELQRVQKGLRVRRKKIEKRLETGRKDIEKRLDTQRKQFEKRTAKLRAEIEKNPAVKRLDAIRKDATKQFEQGASRVLNSLQIASKSDLDRIDRKISAINKQMKEMGGRRKRPTSEATA